MPENNTKKRIEEALGNAPEVKKYSIKELEKNIQKNIHKDGICPKTGRQYREIRSSRVHKRVGPLSGGIGRAYKCSECGEFLGYNGIKF